MKATSQSSTLVIIVDWLLERGWCRWGGAKPKSSGLITSLTEPRDICRKIDIENWPICNPN